MAQRKKKPSGHHLENIAKAHKRNEFLRKLKFICNGCCGEDIYSLLTPEALESIYSVRFHSFKIVPAEGQLVSNHILKSMRTNLSLKVKIDKIALPKFGMEISLEDYFTVGLTLQIYSVTLKEQDFKHADTVLSALQNMGDAEEIYQDGLAKLYNLISLLGFWDSQIGGNVYWLKFDQQVNTTGSAGVSNLLEVYSHKSESTRIKIDGAFRPVIRLSWGFANKGLELSTLSPSLLNINNDASDHPIKVYIQDHTIRRLNERIDCIFTSVSHMYVFASFRDPKVFYDNHHNILIEHRIFNYKVGYFRVDIIDGIAVVRTFLFLTQGGTPEGQLLWKNTGLQKLDTKYLAIDKLSSFMSSDICENEKVRKIFRDSGCQCLMDLYANIDDMCIKHPSQSISKLMLEYLMYNNAPDLESVPE